MIDYGYGIHLDTLDKASNARNWRNEKAIFDYCRQVGLISERHHKNWIEEGDTQHMFAVICGTESVQDYGAQFLPAYKDSPLCVGVAGLTSVHPVHRTAEISLYAAPEYQKKCGARPIIKTLASYAFETLGLNRIFGETFTNNEHEILNLKELGFVHEGILRQTYYKNGKFIDSVIQSLLREDYERIKGIWKQ